MIEGRRLRRLVVSVLLLSGLFVVVARRVGRPEPSAVAARTPADAAGGRAAGSDAGADRADAIGDLSFFQGLGKLRAGATEVAPGVPRAGADRDGAGGPPSAAWVVQAMATTDAAAARRLRDRLGRAGLAATIVEDHQPTRTAYRVRVGRYRDRSVAEVMARRLRDDYGLSPWILQDGD